MSCRENRRGVSRSIQDHSKTSLMTPRHHLSGPGSILGTSIFDLRAFRETAIKDCFKEKLHTRRRPSNQNLPTYVFYFCHVDFYKSMAPSWSSQVINGPFRCHFGSIRPSYRRSPRRVPCFEESASHHAALQNKATSHALVKLGDQGPFRAKPTEWHCASARPHRL